MSKLTPAGSVKGLQTRSFCRVGTDEHTWAWEVSVTSFHLDFESLCLPQARSNSAPLQAVSRTQAWPGAKNGKVLAPVVNGHQL